MFNLKEAKELQVELARRVVTEDNFLHPIQFIGGMDVSCNRFDPSGRVYAATVVLAAQHLSLVETKSAVLKSQIPYRTGFLSFRETPALLQAFHQLTERPDLLFVDGQGIAHPRGIGIASHIGVLLDIPTIGVAKTILVGKPEGELGWEAGSQVPLMWQGKEIARCLRSKKGSTPLIISAGHRISLNTAVTLVCNTLKGYKLPEPTRLAHLACNYCRLKTQRDLVCAGKE